MRRIATLLFILCFAHSLLGQSTNASVTGFIQDSSKAFIPGVTVVAINTDTNTRTSVKTDKSGIYTLPSLVTGPYQIQVEKPGFKTIVKEDLVLHVQDALQINFLMAVGSMSETITVNGSGENINTTDASVSTVFERQLVENIPLNGRSFQDLISMTPGVVTASPQIPSTLQAAGYTGDFSVNGQRTETNYYTVDGVSGNIVGGTGGGGTNGAGTSGSLGATTALGTTQSLVSVDALQEFRVQSSTYSAEYGRTPGGQFSLLTRSGTDKLHGTAFDYLRNNFFDANDWFNDHFGSPTPALRQNDFGGTLGGPVTIPHIYNRKDKSFFFVSYEGLRLTQPQAAAIQLVPDTYMRLQAAPAMQPILNAFPKQNGIDYGTSSSPSLAQFILPYSVPSRIDSTSFRGDDVVNPHLTLFFRYSDTPSSTTGRQAFSVLSTAFNTQTYTMGATSALSSRITNEFRLGYSRVDSRLTSTLDSFGGAAPTNLDPLVAQGSYATLEPFIEISIAGAGLSALAVANGSSNRSRQWNLVDNINISAGRHQIKLGIDYRRVKSPSTPTSPLVESLYLSSQSVIQNDATEAAVYSRESSTPIFNETAVFAQDEWKAAKNLNLSLGLRWELDPAPTGANGNDAYTLFGNIGNPSTLTLAPQGTPLWKTTKFNFAPRLGLAWTVHTTPNWETVVRTGAGVFFDTDNQEGAYGFGGIGFNSYKLYFGAALPFTQAQVSFPPSTAAPYTADSVYLFPSHLQLPYSLEWNASLQQALGRAQTVTFTYVASEGRRLIEAQTFNVSSFNSQFGSLLYFPSSFTSNYQALQFQFQRTVAHGLHAMASYTWSHSIDFGSADSALPVLRGNSDFDVRNNFVGGLSWDLPKIGGNRIVKILANDWGVDGRLVSRTAFPVALNGSLSINAATGGQYYNGLNLIPNQPIYLYGPQYPGGRSINKAAFALPASGQTGNAPRNFVRGFGENQVNLAVRREFPIHDTFRFQFRAETFNLLNHPNFGYVDPSYTDATFGQATKMLNTSLGTVASQYQQGGARSMQFALKLLF